MAAWPATAGTLDVVSEATFRHVREIPWTPVQQQRNADGSVSVVRERWPIFRPDFLSAYVHYEPGMVVRRHGHRSNHVVFVIDGGVWLRGDWCTAGAHVHVPLGAAFGPIVAGPEGVTCWELSFGEFGGWGDELELFDAEIAARGVTPLPDPPLELAEWFVDPRGDVGADRGTPKVEGMKETITVVHDLPVVDDPSTPGVHTRFAVDEPGFVSTYVEYDPGAVAPARTYAGHHLALVLSGSATVGDVSCTAGMHIEVPPGATLGPVVAGDDGFALLALTSG